MNIRSDYNEKELKRIARLSGSKQAEKDAHIVAYLGFRSPEKMYCEYIGGVAFINGMVGKSIMRIYGVAVAESYKRKGIATFLLNRVLEFAKRKGLQKITTKNDCWLGILSKEWFPGCRV